MANNSVGLIFLGIGVLAVILAGVLFIRLRRFLATARAADGIVTGLRTTTDDEGDQMYAPVVEFRTESGVRATYKSNVYSRPCKYNAGDRVDILYNPDNPADAQIKGRQMNVLPMLILGGLGMIFAIVGVVLVVAIPQG